jgi:hypothetical protein
MPTMKMAIARNTHDIIEASVREIAKRAMPAAMMVPGLAGDFWKGRVFFLGLSLSMMRSK